MRSVATNGVQPDICNSHPVLHGQREHQVATNGVQPDICNKAIQPEMNWYASSRNQRGAARYLQPWGRS